ncbi:hypothetical protein KBX19_09795 [Corynebacterium sp. CCUG 71335]|uniref:hypothetical protein n=1 Tax=Corynebacterium sp. CCUG 71335 TaxID=2823892 RepID=UPI002109EA40|nr:hypothetical protein [Corynebacterium sp. CCUG 71335]MCQ4621504.1 hypothetical protein [Corynebacterium sp. CCUG 71335]
MPGDTATQVAELAGLHTPVPDRHETMSDELLEHYVNGLDKVLQLDDFDVENKTDIVRAVNEFLKAKHHYLFDQFEQCYYAEPHFAFRSQVFFSLKKLAGTKEKYLDRMLEMYLTDHRSIGTTNEMLKEYFQTLFIKNGRQRHWDAIAETADTDRDIEFITLIAGKSQRQLERHGVNPWIPTLDDAKRVTGKPEHNTNN